MAPIQRRAADVVFDLLRQRIVSGELPPGGRLDPTEVAAEFEMSRTPVREAILRLDAAGLVERLPYRGVVVSQVDTQAAEDVAAMRMHLETLAARLATPRLRPEDLEAMRTTHESISAVLAGSGDADQFSELNRAFHTTLYRRADSPVLLRTLEDLAGHADRFRRHFDLRNSPVQAQHEAILAACEAGDVEAVTTATRDHILAAHLRMMPTDYFVVPDSLLALALRAAGLDPSALPSAG